MEQLSYHVVQAVVAPKEAAMGVVQKSAAIGLVEFWDDYLEANRM